MLLSFPLRFCNEVRLKAETQVHKHEIDKIRVPILVLDTHRGNFCARKPTFVPIQSDFFSAFSPFSQVTECHTCTKIQKSACYLAFVQFTGRFLCPKTDFRANSVRFFLNFFAKKPKRPVKERFFVYSKNELFIKPDITQTPAAPFSSARCILSRVIPPIA